MFPRMSQWIRKFRQDASGVTSLEYCILFGGVGFLIVLGSFQYLAPGINNRLGNAFNPAFVLGGEGVCVAHNMGNKVEDGNCGVGLGGGGGNGTPNEGNGQGPGPDKDKFDNPGKGNK
jgi:Flp pilus assembly pilin Flp